MSNRLSQTEREMLFSEYYYIIDDLLSKVDGIEADEYQPLLERAMLRAIAEADTVTPLSLESEILDTMYAELLNATWMKCDKSIALSTDEEIERLRKHGHPYVRELEISNHDDLMLSVQLRDAYERASSASSDIERAVAHYAFVLGYQIGDVARALGISSDAASDAYDAFVIKLKDYFGVPNR